MLGSKAGEKFKIQGLTRSAMLVAALRRYGLSCVMPLDERDWRPITFQGVTFPATLMGISILEPVLDITDEELGVWLWRFPICCGVSKSAPAERCARCAKRVVDVLLEERQRVLDGIEERLAPHGFEPESTYRDWIVALQRIAELSRVARGDCIWSAPSHPDDPYKTAADFKGFLAGLDRAVEKLRGEES